MANKFMIHFRGAPYSNELYDERGREVFDLETAIETAENQYSPDEYEVYNGSESHSTFVD